MAQGIVTYSEGPSAFGKGWEVDQVPNAGNFFSATFDGLGDYARFSVVESGSATAAANAGNSAHTITVGGSKNRHLFPNFTCTPQTDTAFIEVKIKRADSGVVSNGLFVGFSESTVAGDIIATSGVKAAAAAGKDRIGIACLSGTDNCTLVSYVDTTETIADVDSGRDMADDTYIRLGVVVQASTVKFYIDGDLVKQYEGGNRSPVTMTPVLAVAGSNAATVDYFIAGVR